MNRDPIGEDGGINLYAFVGNNPVEREDRLGLQSQSSGDTKNYCRCCCVDDGTFDEALNNSYLRFSPWGSPPPEGRLAIEFRIAFKMHNVASPEAKPCTYLVAEMTELPVHYTDIRTGQERFGVLHGLQDVHDSSLPLFADWSSTRRLTDLLREPVGEPYIFEYFDIPSLGGATRDAARTATQRIHQVVIMKSAEGCDCEKSEVHFYLDIQLVVRDGIPRYRETWVNVASEYSF